VAPVAKDIPYVEHGDPLQTLDVYAPANAKNLPVVVWIHGGGWQAGDKSDVGQKPQAFLEKGFVFVSVGYRLWPKVVMGDIIRDAAKSVHWVHDHISTYGGDPARLFIMGHSAGAQLAALLCTDERYLQAEGLSFAILKGCVPVDGDTYDVPAIIAVEEMRQKTHGLPRPKAGHPEKFGTEEQQKDYSAVTHVAKDKGIPPFLLLYVADHPDTSAQAIHLGTVLKAADVPTTLFGAKETNHNKLNNNLGVAGDPATDALYAFVETALKK
jgi:acetyl esterase/lipase